VKKTSSETIREAGSAQYFFRQYWAANSQIRFERKENPPLLTQQFSIPQTMRLHQVLRT